MSIFRRASGSPCAEAVLRDGWYQGNFTHEWHEQQFHKWNSLPPDQMVFCPGCGAPVAWRRSVPSFNVRDGRPGASYRFECSSPETEWTIPNRQIIEIHHYNRGFYSSAPYLWLARDDEHIATADIRPEDYA